MRDFNIKKAYTREISLNTKVVKSKKHYTRKLKHKKKQIWLELSLIRILMTI